MTLSRIVCRRAQSTFLRLHETNFVTKTTSTRGFRDLHVHNLHYITEHDLRIAIATAIELFSYICTSTR